MMLREIGWSLALVVGVLLVVARAESPVVPTAVVGPKEATFAEKLAVKEVRRYVYARTGKLLPIVEGQLPAEGGLIVVGTKDQPLVKQLLADAKLKTTVEGLAAEQYVVKTIQQGSRPVILAAGGDTTGTLYAAYRLAEHLGVRFYMHGDVVPDKQIPPAIAPIDEVGKPLFDRRGIQPFHDFPEGPDWWNLDDYKAILGQLAKMRMNFFGLHTYPQGGVGPEPLTWIGVPGDVGPDGKPKFSYPSRHYVTQNVTGAWGYRSMKTSDFSFMAANIFPRDDYGADYMQGTYPWNKMTVAESNALFERMGEVLRDSFTLARQLGIKTCIGTETPLIIPSQVKERLRQAGKNPDDPAVVQEVYEGMFRRIMKTHPLDYYWLWTPEGWTWNKVEEAHIKDTMADFRAVLAAAEKVKAPFTLATCGWVLGPPQDPSLFDNTLPKKMPMSCISRQVGNAPVEPGFTKVQGRPKWSIPWMEDDPGIILPQLWAGRMRRDAADSLAYGCTGLMGIHWRTRILAPNVSALAKAAWDQSGWGDLRKLAPGARPREGAAGGQPATSDHAIRGTADGPLYQSARYNVSAYRFNVATGSYDVTLKFCETRATKKGERVFGVKIQGERVIERLDIFAEAGANKAYDRKFVGLHVSGNDQLVIEFLPQVGVPCICGIEIVGTGARRNINCGGPKYKDYEADQGEAVADGTPRYLPVDDFYADWCKAEFGPEASEAIARIFTKIDCRLPRPADWIDGPGNVRPDRRLWSAAAKDYAFVDELAALRPKVVGAGNLERFDYWLENFRYLRAMGQLDCTMAQFDAVMAKVKAERKPEAKKQLAQEVAWPLYQEMVSQTAAVHRHLLLTVTNAGEMGTVANWQQHNLPTLLIKSGQELAAARGEPWVPPDMSGSFSHSRLAVRTVRTSIAAGEKLEITAILTGRGARGMELFWRPMGSKADYNVLPMTEVRRGYHRATLPAAALREDLEYYVFTRGSYSPPGDDLRWPAMGTQTVVVVK